MTVTADIQDYGQRIATGKRIEKEIFAALKQRGMNLAPPTHQEDTQDKIDGWIIDVHGQRHSLQIKYRENGDDIIFEILKDADTYSVGRDMECKAEYYIVVDRQGTGRLFLTAPIKKRAEQLLRTFQPQFLLGKDRWKGIGWELKITLDRAHGQRKLMAYLNPCLFEIIGEWNNLI